MTATAVKDKKVVEPDQQIVVPEPSFSKRDEIPSPQAQPTTLMNALATAAADPRMDVAKVKELYAIHKEMMDREARAAFNDALARAQASIQPIATDRRNDHTKSRYATLAAINEALVPIYTAEGLSVSFGKYKPKYDAQGKEINPPQQGWLRVLAIVSHKGGLEREYELDGPLDDAGKDGTKNKTGIQAMGSTSQYLQRYLTRMIFNVTSFDEDNDGNGGRGTGNRMDEKVLGKHLDLINGSESEADVLKNFAKAYNEAEELKDKEAQRQFLSARDNRRKELGKGRRS